MSKVSVVIERGSRFGGLEVVERVHNEVRGEWEYRCRCLLCGGELTVRLDNLRKERVGCRACSNRVIAQRRFGKKS